MHVDVDPLKKADFMYLEIAGLNMVEIFEIDPIMATNGSKVDIEMVTEGHKCANTVITEDQYEEKIQGVFPKAEEDLIDFLNICKISGSSVMICPRCSAVFDKKAAKNVEGFRPRSKRKGKLADIKPKFSFEKANISIKDTSSTANQKNGPMKTFSPPSKSPNNQWVFSGGKKPNDKSPPTKWVKKGIGGSPVEQWVFSGGKKTTGNGNRNKIPDQREEKYMVPRGSFITSITKGEIP